jgi:uncharacterized membrane protein
MKNIIVAFALTFASVIPAQASYVVVPREYEKTEVTNNEWKVCNRLLNDALIEAITHCRQYEETFVDWSQTHMVCNQQIKTFRGVKEVTSKVGGTIHCDPVL